MKLLFLFVLISCIIGFSSCAEKQVTENESISGVPCSIIANQKAKALRKYVPTSTADDPCVSGKGNCTDVIVVTAPKPVEAFESFKYCIDNNNSVVFFNDSTTSRDELFDFTNETYKLTDLKNGIAIAKYKLFNDSTFCVYFVKASNQSEGMDW